MALPYTQHELLDRKDAADEITSYPLTPLRQASLAEVVRVPRQQPCKSTECETMRMAPCSAMLTTACSYNSRNDIVIAVITFFL